MRLVETLSAELRGGELEGQGHWATAAGQNTTPGVLGHRVVVVRQSTVHDDDHCSWSLISETLVVRSDIPTSLLRDEIYAC